MSKGKKNEITLSDALAASGDVAYDWDLTHDEIIWFGDTEPMLFRPARSLKTGKNYQARLHPGDLAHRHQALNAHFEKSDVVFDCEYRVQGDDNDFQWVHERAQVIFENNKPVRLQGVLRLISDRKSKEADLDRKAHYDALTGYLNEGRLRSALEDAVLYAVDQNHVGSFMVIAIDNLPLINEAYGYKTADEIIVEIGVRLEQCLRTSDVIGRIGGNRFALILNNCDHTGFSTTAERIIELVNNTPIPTPTGDHAVTVSIGGVNFPTSVQTPYEIIIRAESALMASRRQGCNRHSLFVMSEKERQQKIQDLEVGKMVRDALRNNRLFLAYQPILRADTQEVDYYECLVRMKDAHGHIIPAKDFIPVAEDLGLMREIDQHIAQKALAVMEKSPDLKLAINVSGYNVGDGPWLRFLSRALRYKPEIAQRLVVEITETAAFHDMDEAVRFVETLRDLGCQVALDDFGAGYTSFTQIRSLPVDIVKIDGSFVQDLENNIGNQLFISTLLDLAQGFGLKVVAECVETQAQVDYLCDAGVHYLQGHYFSDARFDCPAITA